MTMVKKRKILLSLGGVLLLIFALLALLPGRDSVQVGIVGVEYVKEPPLAAISLRSDHPKPLQMWVKSIESKAGEEWEVYPTPEVNLKMFNPQSTNTFSVHAPKAVGEWRVRFGTAGEKKGADSILPRIKWFIGQAMQGFPNGFRLPMGKILDGEDFVTPGLPHPSAPQTNRLLIPAPV